MNDAFRVLLAMAYAYLVGSVPTAYLVAQWARGVDIRRYGSGNVGASNVGRHVGRKAFVLVAVFDVLVKGSATVAIVWALGLSLEYQAIAALLATIGHNWSVFLRFGGGRGLSVATGTLLVLAWKELLATLGVALVGWLIFRSTALWLGIALVLLPIWAILFREPSTIFWYCVGAVMVGALKRLLSNPGTATPGRRWRDMAIPRLLYDRDTFKPGDWVTRSPEDDTGGR